MKGTAIVGAGHCETSRRFVDCSSREPLCQQLPRLNKCHVHFVQIKQTETQIKTFLSLVSHSCVSSSSYPPLILHTPGVCVLQSPVQHCGKVLHSVHKNSPALLLPSPGHWSPCAPLLATIHNTSGSLLERRMGTSGGLRKTIL